MPLWHLTALAPTLNKSLPEPEKTFSTELTEYELQTLVWLWIAVSEQQQLIEHLNPALQQLGSSLAPTAHSRGDSSYRGRRQPALKQTHSRHPS